MCLRPPAGTALLFGGTITHSGVAVTSGERSVLVASFSPSSREDGTSDFSRQLAARSDLKATNWLMGALDGLDGLI